MPRQSNRRHGPRTMDHGPRAAFTLVELLVVMAIMATLMALTAAGISKVIANNKQKTSESIVGRIAGLAEQSVRAVLDDAKEPKPPQAFCQAPLNPSGDQSVARTKFTEALLMQQFPMSFTEVQTPTNNLPADSTYSRKVGTAASTGTPEELSQLLYLALTSKNRRGDMVESQFVAEYTQDNPNGLVSIRDAWGTPIIFHRQLPPNNPVIVVISAGANRKFGTTNYPGGVPTPADNDANDNIYSVFVGR